MFSFLRSEKYGVLHDIGKASLINEGLQTKNIRHFTEKKIRIA